MPAPANRIAIYQVDAFTDRPFCGNPAGVVPDAAGLTESQMQLIAREMAVSETAFVLPPAGPGDVRLRFFTPQAEVALCGHATIGAFHLLAALGRLPGQGEFAGGRDLHLRQETAAGLLGVTVRLKPSGEPDRVLMEQAQPKRVLGANPKLIGLLERVLGAGQGELGVLPGYGAAPVEAWSTGLPDILVPVRDLESLRGLKPDLPALAELSRRLGVISVHAFTLETEKPAAYAHARDFSPAVGIPEEAATGTASGALAAYLVANGLVPERPAAGFWSLLFEQGHILDRPSAIEAQVEGQIGRPAAVRVGGRAVVVLEGTIAW